MAVRPVRFISDVLTRKQILKTDANDNVLFNVSGSKLSGGHVSSSFPLTASGLYIDGNAHINGTISANRMHVTEVTTSVYYESALSASINALNDVSAANAQVNDLLVWNGSNWIAANEITATINGNLNGTASNSLTSSYSLLANHSITSNTASYAIEAATALTALYALNAGNLVGSGTTNYIPVFTNNNEISDSTLSLSGSTLIAGADLVISGALQFSSPNNLTNIDLVLNSPTGFYSVSDVFGFINNRFNDIKQNYSALNETTVGFFNSDGSKNIELNNFSVNDMDNLIVDVMVKLSGTNQYTNDLISVAISGNIVTNKVHVKLDALSLSINDSYRLIVVKQTGSLF
jgi:hypothetical protein